jgi:ABC-type transport system, involved in lipoprotein release, permease component
MKNALFKDTLREIKKTFSRFISIFAIVALGVSFFAGVKATCPDMKITADKYFDDYNLMDIRLVSTIGFNDDDVKAVQGVSGVSGAFPTYSMDAMVSLQERDLVLKVLALPADKIGTSDPSYINRTKLVSGRYPQKPDECVAEKGKIINSKMAVGSKIRLTSGSDKDISDSLKVSEFTIVGIVETPYYISFERGTSSIGNGKINSFIMVPQEDFKIPAYTDLFLTVNNAKDVLCYDKSYDDIIKPVKDALDDTGKDRAQIRYDEIIADANKELDSKKKELSDAEEGQKTELESAQAKLESSRKKIADGEIELKNKQNQFNITVKDAENKISEGYKKLNDGETQYSVSLQTYNDAKAKADTAFPAAEAKIAAAQKEIDSNEAQLNLLKAALAAGMYLTPEQKALMETQISQGEQQLSAAKAQLAASKAELDAQKKSLSDAEAQLTAARKLLDDTKLQLESQSKNLEESKKSTQAQLVAARTKLNASKKQLQEGEDAYSKAKSESDEKLADARKKISDAEEQINSIEKPVWYTLGRDTNPGFVDYGMAADRMDAIAEVFPVFLFLVAALVCLTTMTRMVDEQRTHIGTLKALGYSKISVASKYLLYAALASISGSIFGFTLGFKIFPTVIFNAYGIMYTLPHVIAGFNPYYAAVSTAFAVLSTTLAAWIACYSELSAAPAQLMRPKSPKAGKRIFLERIKFLWTRFNFTKKITARNLLRYKRRFFMTVLGIGGCTALLLAGFGLKDSIMSIVSKQFDELYKYNMVIGLKDNVEDGKQSALSDVISGDSRITDYMYMREQSIDAGSGNTEKSVTLTVPEKAEKLKDFIIFRIRTTGQDVPFTNDGVVLTEKLAKKLQVGVGDEIYIKDGDTKKINVKVSGIIENYVSHYIYMSPSLYESVFGRKAEFKEIIAKTSNASEDFENKLSTGLLKNPGVDSVSFTTGISKNFKDIISSLNYVVLVLIFSAGALAFVVLYNLTNINVTERLREIATIKVLGFYDREVSAYVYRENMILTIIGILLGLILGIFLHRFIVVTAEVDYVMFGRDIKPMSFLYSAALTVLFSGFVNFIMYYRLKKISMVESLKSVD